MASKHPMIVIGGPPQRGKSVLGAILSECLERRQISHYLLDATPDGEGKWFQRAPRWLAARLRHKHRWSASFEKELEGRLGHGALPLLVSAGGLPTPSQVALLFGNATHALLVGGGQAEWALWRGYAAAHGVPILAEVRSRQHGAESIEGGAAPLRVTLGGLARGSPPSAPLSPARAALVEAVAQVLVGDEAALQASHCALLPAGVRCIVVAEWLARLAPGAQAWRRTMLPELLAALPQAELLGLYGARLPAWLVGAVAAHNGAPLHVYNANVGGWVLVPTLAHDAAAQTWRAEVAPAAAQGWQRLDLTLDGKYLTAAPAIRGPLPTIAEPGVLLCGQLPLWLFAALVRHYLAQGKQVAITDPALACGVQVSAPGWGDSVAWQMRDSHP